MAVNYTRLLQFFQQFGKFYTHQFSPFLARTGLSMREVHVLLFLANNPSYDTARDVTEFRGLSKSQVSQAVELLAAERILRRTPDAADRRGRSPLHHGARHAAGPGMSGHPVRLRKTASGGAHSGGAGAILRISANHSG